MKLYGFETFNVSKCTLTAEFGGVAYDYVAVNPAAGEHKTPEHIRRHPLGKVPVLELDDGRCLFESGAICRYLGRVSSGGLYAGDDYELGIIDTWVDYAGQHVGRWMGMYFFQEIVRARVQRQPVDAAALAEAQGWLDQQLPAVENQLARNAYLAGEHITVADTYLAAYVQVHEVTSLSLDAYPRLLAWYEGLRGQNAYARAMDHFAGGQLLH